MLLTNAIQAFLFLRVPWGIVVGQNCHCEDRPVFENVSALWAGTRFS